MKIRLLILMFILQVAFHSLSQEMKVKSVTSDVTDLSAKIKPRYSSDGAVCALLKIICPQSGIAFQSDGIVGEIEYDSGEYKVYFACNAKDLMIMSKNNGQLNLSLAKYNVLPLQPNLVYYVLIDLINDISVDERVRLYRPVILSSEEKTALMTQVADIHLTPGVYGADEEKELSTLFYEKGCIAAGARLGFHYITGLLKGDSISTDKISEGEFLLKVAVEYDDDASASKLLGDYFYNFRSYDNAFEYYFIGHTKQNADASNCLALMMENGLGSKKDVEGALDIWRDIFWNRDGFSKALTPNNETIFEHFIRLKSAINTPSEFSSESAVEYAAKIYDKTSITGVKAVRLPFIDWEKVDRKYYPILYNILKIALNDDASVDAAVYFVELFSRAKPYSLSSCTDMDMFYPDDLPDKEEIISKSINIINEATSRGHINAMKSLAKLYLDGKFINKSEDRALEILIRGSELGDASMAGKAEDILDKAHKFDEAFRYRKLAYDLGNRNWKLVLRLADNYATGDHCVKDPQRALELYNEILSNSIGHDKSIIKDRIRDLKIENKI